MTSRVKKVLLWIPCGLTMLFLAWFVYWLRTSFTLNRQEAFLIASATVFYGALLVGSSDIRRKYWPKSGRKIKELVR